MQFLRKSSTPEQMQGLQSQPISGGTINPPAANSSWKRLQRPLSIMTYSKDLSDSMISESSLKAMTPTEYTPKRSFFSLRKKSTPPSTVETTSQRRRSIQHNLSKRASMPLDGFVRLSDSAAENGESNGYGAGTANPKSIRSRNSADCVPMSHRSTQGDLAPVNRGVSQLSIPKSTDRAPAWSLSSHSTQHKAVPSRRFSCMEPRSFSTLATATNDTKTSKLPTIQLDTIESAGDTSTDSTTLFIENELAYLDTSFDLLRTSITMETSSVLGDEALISPAPSSETFESAGYSIPGSCATNYSSAPSSVMEDHPEVLKQHRPRPVCGIVWVGDSILSSEGIKGENTFCSIFEAGQDFDDEDFEEETYNKLRPRMVRTC